MRGSKLPASTLDCQPDKWSLLVHGEVFTAPDELAEAAADADEAAEDAALAAADAPTADAPAAADAATTDTEDATAAEAEAAEVPEQ